jgi:hypothetical protein
MNATRINLSLLDKDVEKLKKIYNERYLPYRMADKLSFTGFCAMMVMFAAEVVEGTDYVFSYEPVMRGKGRPKEVKE